MKGIVVITSLSILIVCGCIDDNTNKQLAAPLPENYSMSSIDQAKYVPQTDVYPHEIAILKAQKLYDETVWDLYCISASDTCLVSRKYNLLQPSYPFYNLELRYEGCSIKKDTIDILFGFYLDSIRCDAISCDGAYPMHGCRFKIGVDTPILYLDDNFNELSPNFLLQKKSKGLEYILTADTVINNWLLYEAKKRVYLR